MQDSEILEILKVAEEDGKWVSEKYGELQEKYAGRVLAIRNKSVVGNAESIEELLEIVKEKGEDASLILIETVLPKNVSLIL
jgi:hypothetical protein